MKTVSGKWFTKMLAGTLAVAMTIAFVPAFTSQASAATVKYKKVSTKNYTVKLPAGKSWTQEKQTVTSEDIAGLTADLNLTAENDNSVKSIDFSYSAKDGKNVQMVSFAGFKTAKKVTMAELKAVKAYVNPAAIKAINNALNQDETLSAYGTFNIKSVKVKTVKVKKYKTALQVTVNATFKGSGYNITAKPVVYVTVKNKNILATAGLSANISSDGKVVKITSNSTVNNMAKKALESVTIK